MTYTATPEEQSKSLPENIAPMPLWQALFYFGLPAILFRISLYNGTPALIRIGLSPFEANVVSFTVPAAMNQSDRPRRIKGLSEVSIRVRDLDAMHKFYEEVVGLEVLRRDDSFVFFKIADGHSGLL